MPKLVLYLALLEPEIFRHTLYIAFPKTEQAVEKVYKGKTAISVYHCCLSSLQTKGSSVVHLDLDFIER